MAKVTQMFSKVYISEQNEHTYLYMHYRMLAISLLVLTDQINQLLLTKVYMGRSKTDSKFDVSVTIATGAHPSIISIFDNITNIINVLVCDWPISTFPTLMLPVKKKSGFAKKKKK